MTPSERSHEPRTTVRWKHGAIPVVGLTGGVGGGKSEVATILAERGSAVIDADSIGHDLLDDPPVRARIAARFGDGVLARAGLEPGAAPRIDRRALGAIVFADPEGRRALEAILHPLMRARFLAAIQREMQAGRSLARSVVLDAAILQEAGWDDLCDLVVFVDAPRPERMRRAARQRGWSAETFLARERAQWPCDEKRRRAALVIVNDAGVDSLRRELARLDILLALLPHPPDEACRERAGSGAAEPDLPIPQRMVFDSPSPSGG
ncbi:MAG: dephospho-CoA kinase [Isosphaerales bacterium]